MDHGAVNKCAPMAQTMATNVIRYQLLHRTTSAVLAARQFFAQAAVMLVHSFSPTDRWFEDFVAFARLFKASPRIGELVHAGQCGQTQLFLGWCKGDQRFRSENA